MYTYYKALFPLFFSLTISLFCKELYIVTHPSVANNYLFEVNSDFLALKKACTALGHTLSSITHSRPVPDAEHLLVFEVPGNNNLTPALGSVPLEKRTLVLWEPPVILPHSYEKTLHANFGTVFTMCEQYITSAQYKKLFQPRASFRQLEPIDFNKKRFCTTIIGNKYATASEELYTARRNLVRFFEQNHPDEFDLYGTWWNQQENPSYRGQVSSKEDILKLYKFSVAYENSKHVTGYITEKIFDCLEAGTVPIYWGADNIRDYIPGDCFIDRDMFQSDQELYTYLKKITEQEYKDYCVAIKKYLASDASFLFSTQYFVHIMLEHLFPGYDRNKVFSSYEQQKILRADQLYNK
jgi:hypothetical protein